MKAEGNTDYRESADQYPQVPPLACDCHAHIFGDPVLYSMTHDRAYDPAPATAIEYSQLLQNLGVERAVLIQPSIYGFDNRAQLDAMVEIGIECRAVVVLEPKTSEATIREFHRQGVRGVRTNLLLASGPTLSDLLVVAKKIVPFGWHIDLCVGLEQLTDVESALDQLELPVVLDHMANWHPEATRGETQLLRRLLDHENVWIKLSSIHRLSRMGPPYDDLAELVTDVISAAPDRVLWGSDWPYPLYDGLVDCRSVITAVMDWCGGSQAINRIFVENPERLFGFQSENTKRQDISRG